MTIYIYDDEGFLLPPTDEELEEMYQYYLEKGQILESRSRRLMEEEL